MSNVVLTIAGRSFTVACAAGEEDHVAGLGQMIDAKIATMGDVAGQSESRMLLFASLLLADELHALKAAGQDTATRSRLADLDSLESVALRLENLAARLETPRPSA